MDECTQLMADYNAKKNGHVRLEKHFKLQTEANVILGGVSGRDHVDKIRANAKLTKILQYTDTARIIKNTSGSRLTRNLLQIR